MGQLGRYSALAVLWGAVGLVISGCAGDSGSSQANSAADTTTAGDAVQASEDALDAALEKFFEESRAPGVVAAVQTPEYTWVGPLGVADIATQKPMTPDVHQRIGSVTKTFTITLLLQAAAEGLLSLDNTIDQYIEGIPRGIRSRCARWLI